jgi:hypothetical protein
MNAILFEVICRRRQGSNPDAGWHRQTKNHTPNRLMRRRKSLYDSWDTSLAADCIAKTVAETD